MVVPFIPTHTYRTTQHVIRFQISLLPLSWNFFLHTCNTPSIRDVNESSRVGSQAKTWGSGSAQVKWASFFSSPSCLAKKILLDPRFWLRPLRGQTGQACFFLPLFFFLLLLLMVALKSSQLRLPNFFFSFSGSRANSWLPNFFFLLLRLMSQLGLGPSSQNEARQPRARPAQTFPELSYRRPEPYHPYPPYISVILNPCAKKPKCCSTANKHHRNEGTSDKSSPHSS